MKRTLFVFFLFTLFVPQAFAAKPIPGWTSTLAEAQQQAKKGNRLIFVDMFADWCGWCHKIEKEVFPTPQFKAATKNMVLLRLDTEDGKEGTQFSRSRGVRSLPTFLILTADLQLAGEIRGYAPTDPFVARIDEIVASHEKFQKLVASEASFGSDQRKRVDLGKEFIARQQYAAAEERLKKAIASSGSLPAEVRDDAFYHLAVAQVRQKKFAEARQTIQKAKQLKGKSDAAQRTYLLLGELEIEQGNLKAALDTFVRFKVDFPSSPLVRNVEQVIPRLEQAVMAASGGSR